MPLKTLALWFRALSLLLSLVLSKKEVPTV
jgi:hypothetical protein